MAVPGPEPAAVAELLAGTVEHTVLVPALDPTVLALAGDQHGALTTAQLLAAGTSPTAILHLVRQGVLEHPGRGLYLVTSLKADDETGRHRQLATGALLLYPDAVLAGQTALRAHGVNVWGAPVERPSILRPIRRARGMSSFWVRPERGSTVSTEWGPATPVAEAVAQHAVDHGLAPGLVSADAALRDRLVTKEELADAVAEVAGWRHGSRASAMLRHCDGRRESVGESRAALALALGGFDLVPQVEIVEEDGRLVARVDFVVRGTKVVVEFDGKVKYGSGDPKVLWDEKRREDRLRALGYTVVRITWAQLERPGLVVALVRRAVAAAA